MDGVSDVTLTPATVDPNAPSSTNATLTALENTATALTESNFGYSDPATPVPSPLANVQITALPALGSLKLSGTPVTLNQIVTVADINSGNLTYLSPLGGFGSPYTTIGIKVQNSALLWSLPAVMTVNVTHVNHAPTSTGGAVIVRIDTVKTFAPAEFHFSDVDAGNTLQAIKVTSLPTNGTLTLSASAVTLNQVVAVADITAGNLIYTPNTGYTGSDPFNFQVRDAALFSADATMAISVTSDIIVQNGSFETPGGASISTHWHSIGSPWINASGNGNPFYMTINTIIGWSFSSVPDGTYCAQMATYYTSYTQDLLTTVNAGDTLSVTFSGGRPIGGTGGQFTASFLVGATEYTSSVIDTTLLAQNSWQSYTFTTPTPITNTGNLSLKFTAVTDAAYLDMVSNVSVTSGGGTNYTLTYTAGAHGSITGTSPQTVASGGNGTAVTPVPDAGYHFVDWSDASTSNPRQDLAVSGNITVTANFAINTIAYTTWALANAGGGLAEGDSNNDGVKNGIAYFMNATGIATNPALDATTRTVSWTNGGIIPSSDYGNQFVVQTSDDLVIWTDVLLSDTTHLTNTTGSVSYTFTGTAPHFVRLKVTPNPN